MIDWTPIAPDTPIHDLKGRSCFADSFGGRALVFSIEPLKRAAQAQRTIGGNVTQLRVSTHTTWGLRRRLTTERPAYLPASAVCVSRGLVPRRIVMLPQLHWPRFGAPTVVTSDGRITLRDLVRHGPPASVRLQGALAMADAAKSTHGQMLTDVAYRIEQSALFDSSVSTTRTFDNALAVWSDLDLATALEDDVVRLAGTLKLTFDTARAHAETVGLGHLPATARDDARRAAGAARLVVGAKTDGERAAAQEQVIRILRSLALHYLPDPNQVTLQITTGP